MTDDLSLLVYRILYWDSSLLILSPAFRVLFRFAKADEVIKKMLNRKRLIKEMPGKFPLETYLYLFFISFQLVDGLLPQ